MTIRIVGGIKYILLEELEVASVGGEDPLSEYADRVVDLNRPVMYRFLKSGRVGYFDECGYLLYIRDEVKEHE